MIEEELKISSVDQPTYYGNGNGTFSQNYQTKYKLHGNAILEIGDFQITGKQLKLCLEEILRTVKEKYPN